MHRSISKTVFDIATWRDEFTEEEIQETLGIAGLRSWTFDVWMDGQISFYPPEGCFTRDELEKLIFAFGAAGARVESVFTDDDWKEIGIRIYLEFKHKVPESLCVKCSRATSACRCLPL